MMRRGSLLLLLTAATLPGCATRWELRTAQPALAIQWPPEPAKAKLTYLRSYGGLVATANAARTLANVAYGGDRADTGAFVLPVAVAVGKDGRVAVADLGRSAVHLFVPAEGRYQKLTGTKLEPLRTPVGVAFDRGNRLFVADSSGRLYSFGPDGLPLKVLRSAGSTPFQRPTGLAFSPVSGLLFVVDTLAHTVYALDAEGTPVYSFGGRGDDEGRFNYPTHIAWSEPGELIVADSLNFRIQILDEKGKARAAFGNHGDGSGDIAMPKGVAMDKEGVVYVSDSLFDVVQLFSRRGEFALALGRRGTELGEFWVPAGIFISGTGELWVCDTYNHRVQVFRIEGSK